MKKFIKIILGLLLCAGNVVRIVSSDGKKYILEASFLAQLAIVGGRNILSGLAVGMTDHFAFLPDAEPAVVQHVQNIAKNIAGFKNPENIVVKRNRLCSGSPDAYEMPLQTAEALSSRSLYIDNQWQDLLAGRCRTLILTGPAEKMELTPDQSLIFLNGFLGHELVHLLKNDVGNRSAALIGVPLATWSLGRVVHKKIVPVLKFKLGIAEDSWAGSGIDFVSIATLGYFQFKVNQLILHSYVRSQEERADRLAPDQGAFAASAACMARLYPKQPFCVFTSTSLPHEVRRDAARERIRASRR